ncbi:unnamed protein product [Brachionus calyciflorus]|uniref:NmrA-like family domain-containing protein 1 n=1 Tax=Brachionus calyciflorus TaxID=104777 RepID=A0A813QPQ0_9BILA|nr:unnamed protein product [Brachionus calyciflorus]
MSKIIGVFGSTGAQGGSVLRALVKDGKYLIRAITRNPKSEKAIELSKLKNVTVHQADLDDPSTAIEDYGLKQSDIISFPSIRVPMYYEGLPSLFIKKNDENQFLITLPVGYKPVYFIGVNDIGDCVKSIFDYQDEYKNIILSNPLNLPIDLSLEKFRLNNFPGVEDLAIMFEYFQTGKMIRDIDLAKKLNKSVLSFDQWVEQNKDFFK